MITSILFIIFPNVGEILCQSERYQVPYYEFDRWIEERLINQEGFVEFWDGSREYLGDEHFCNVFL